MDTKLGDTYMVHLANFLRASIFNRHAEVATLEDELKLLVDYLEMQKIRFGLALNCIININKENEKFLFQEGIWFLGAQFIIWQTQLG